MASHYRLNELRLSLWRAAALLFVSLVVLLPIAAEAKVPRAFAGIVIDAKSGKVLYESAADEYRYPASVTKVMTLYVLFQELAAGNIKLSDKMTVSKFAASAVPTKLGLKAGSKITVENAIKALVTLSANDMARVIAEHIAGSESAFAKRMTATAKSLGMKKTNYANASGLPDTRQITTVRDQALLGIAIYEHFPKYYAYFQTKSFSYGKRTYGNHNNLLGKNGVDGIKTGYTQASGYNLLTAARSNDRHIVVAGFGFNKAGTRDAKVRDLVNKYLPKARSGDYLEAALVPQPGRKGSVAPASVQVASNPVFPMPLPSFRQGTVVEAPADPEVGIGDVDTSIAVASISPEPRPADLDDQPALQAANELAGSDDDRVLVTDVIGAWLSENYSLGAAPSALGSTRPSAPILPPVGVGDEGEPIDLMTSGSVELVEVAAVEPQPMPRTLPSGWIVQIGAAPTENGAQSLLSSANQKIASLGGFEPYVQRFEKDGQVFFRARFGGFGDQDDANAMCKELKKAKLSCLAMQS
ncbi:MAG: D-alanyl-D-alanine carboxypeptidase [Devosia sp.]